MATEEPKVLVGENRTAHSIQSRKSRRPCQRWPAHHPPPSASCVAMATPRFSDATLGRIVRASDHDDGVLETRSHSTSLTVRVRIRLFLSTLVISVRFNLHGENSLIWITFSHTHVWGGYFVQRIKREWIQWSREESAAEWILGRWVGHSTGDQNMWHVHSGFRPGERGGGRWRLDVDMVTACTSRQERCTSTCTFYVKNSHVEKRWRSMFTPNVDWNEPMHMLRRRYDDVINWFENLHVHGMWRRSQRHYRSRTMACWLCLLHSNEMKPKGQRASERHRVSVCVRACVRACAWMCVCMSVCARVQVCVCVSVCCACHVCACWSECVLAYSDMCGIQWTRFLGVKRSITDALLQTNHFWVVFRQLLFWPGENSTAIAYFVNLQSILLGSTQCLFVGTQPDIGKGTNLTFVALFALFACPRLTLFVTRIRIHWSETQCWHLQTDARSAHFTGDASRGLRIGDARQVFDVVSVDVKQGACCIFDANHWVQSWWWQ